MLWTDCFQVGMMLASYGAIFIQGSIEAGSFSAAWDIMDKSGRVIFDEFVFFFSPISVLVCESASVVLSLSLSNHP